MPDDDQSYEGIVEELEQVLAELESGGLTLDQALDAYARGVKLSEGAQQLLTEAELRIESLRAES